MTPLVSYFIRDNISIGGRLAYSRSYTKLDNLSLSLGDDISLDINEWNDKSNTYSASFFIRTYLNLGDSKRFGLFNEARLVYGYSKSTSSSDLGSGLTGVHQLKHNLNIGVAPVSLVLSMISQRWRPLSPLQALTLTGTTRKKIRCMMANVLPVRQTLR